MIQFRLFVLFLNSKLKTHGFDHFCLFFSSELIGKMSLFEMNFGHLDRFNPHQPTTMPDDDLHNLRFELWILNGIELINLKLTNPQNRRNLYVMAQISSPLAFPKLR